MEDADMSESFTFGIAELKIEVECRYDYIVKQCRDYMVTDGNNVDMKVFATDEAIENEHKLTPQMPKGYIESICVYREIAERLPRYGAAVFHGAAISYGDKAYIFTAPSGTGKSTHIKLWKKYLGDSVDIVNGDKPIIKKADSDMLVCSTPWAGKENWQKNRIVPIGAVCILKRGKVNRIRKAEPSDVLDVLLGQIYMPKDGECALLSLEILDTLCEKVPVYVLECDISEEAVKASFTAMTGEDYPEKQT